MEGTSSHGEGKRQRSSQNAGGGLFGSPKGVEWVQYSYCCLDAINATGFLGKSVVHSRFDLREFIMTHSFTKNL